MNHQWIIGFRDKVIQYFIYVAGGDPTSLKNWGNNVHWNTFKKITAPEGTLAFINITHLTFFGFIWKNYNTCLQKFCFLFMTWYTAKKKSIIQVSTKHQMYNRQKPPISIKTEWIMLVDSIDLTFLSGSSVTFTPVKLNKPVTLIQVSRYSCWTNI